MFYVIDPMQKWLNLNYCFVRIQNSLTNLVEDNKFVTIFVSKTWLVRLLTMVPVCGTGLFSSRFIVQRE